MFTYTKEDIDNLLSNNFEYTINIQTLSCPKCKSHDVVKNGFDRKGQQRVKCYSCNKRSIIKNVHKT